MVVPCVRRRDRDASQNDLEFRSSRLAKFPYMQSLCCILLHRRTQVDIERFDSAFIFVAPRGAEALILPLLMQVGLANARGSTLLP